MRPAGRASPMDTFPSTLEIWARLALAMLFGGLLGLEREWSRKPAGLRTHIMVALGAACFTLVGFALYTSLVRQESPVARTDPIRVVQGVVGGIGFLCAGAIIQGRGSVAGLTTAGSLWLAGAVGVACGGGHFGLATASVTLGLITLAALGILERYWFPRKAPAQDSPASSTGQPSGKTRE